MIVINAYNCKPTQGVCNNNDTISNCENRCTVCPPDCCNCAPPCHPCQNQCQEGCSANQGDLIEIMGDQGESQGDLSEILGDQTQSQGDLTESLGDQTQSQGDLTESLGDQTQNQGGETQGNQTQGDQTQTMTGHEGQIQGDQFLLNAPDITAPVTVSGLNLNLTVNCGETGKKDVCKDCSAVIACFLRLLKLLSGDAVFYGCCNQTMSVAGTLTDVIDNCIAVIKPEGSDELIFTSLDTLDMVSVQNTGTGSDLFSRLLAYVQSSGCAPNCHCESCCEPCSDCIAFLLQRYTGAGISLQFHMPCSQTGGYLYKICDGIAYITDNLEAPGEITAVPVCRIKCWQAQEEV